MATQRTLVTGGTGFIGSEVVRALLDGTGGGDVHVISSRANAEVPDGVTVHHADLLDAGERQRAVQEIGARRLIHLAWYVEPGQVWSSVENLRWVEATLGLLRDFAGAGGHRAVLAGTCSEYGPEAGRCHEDHTPIAPSNLYGWSKSAVGTTAIAAAPTLGIEVCWARIFYAYGPREHPVRLVSSVARHLLGGEPAPCSHGRQVRDYLSTMDIAAALVALLASDLIGPVNVASGRPVTLREVVTTLAEIIGRPDLVRFGEITPPPDDPPMLVAATDRLNRTVGWQPRFDLGMGLHATVDWWRQSLQT